MEAGDAASGVGSLLAVKSEGPKFISVEVFDHATTLHSGEVQDYLPLSLNREVVSRLVSPIFEVLEDAGAYVGLYEVEEAELGLLRF